MGIETLLKNPSFRETDRDGYDALFMKRYGPHLIPWGFRTLEQLPEENRALFEQRRKRKVLASIAWDVMRDRDGDIKIIELNGSDAGLNGMWDLDGGKVGFAAEQRLVELLQQHSVETGKPLVYLEAYTNPSLFPVVKLLLQDSLVMIDRNMTAADLRNVLYRLDYRHLERRFKEGPDWYTYPQVCDGTQKDFRFKISWYEQQYSAAFEGNQNRIRRGQDAEAVIFNRVPDVYRFDESRFLAVNPFLMTQVIDDKLLSSHVLRFSSLQPAYHYVPDTSDDQYDAVQKFLREEVRGDWIIVKPNDLSCGDGVTPLRKRDVTKSFVDQYVATYGHMLINELVESKDFVIDGKRYQPSMRYVTFVDYEDGIATLSPIGGYWRVPKDSLPSSGLRGAVEPNALVANRNRGAYSIVATPDELAEVQEAITRDLSTIMTRLITFPLYCNQDLYLPRV